MLLQKLFQSIVLIQLLEGVIELINGSLAHLQTTNICSESCIRLILNHVWKINIWKSLNCNFVDTLLKTKDISRKGLVFHVRKWILKFFTFFAGFFVVFVSANYCKIQNKFPNQNHFFLFWEKNPICHGNFFFIVVDKSFHSERGKIYQQIIKKGHPM